MANVGFRGDETAWVGYLHLFQHDMSDINLHSAVKSDSDARDLMDSLLSAASKSIEVCRPFNLAIDRNTVRRIYCHDRFSRDD